MPTILILKLLEILEWNFDSSFGIYGAVQWSSNELIGQMDDELHHILNKNTSTICIFTHYHPKVRQISKIEAHCIVYEVIIMIWKFHCSKPCSFFRKNVGVLCIFWRFFAFLGCYGN